MGRENAMSDFSERKVILFYFEGLLYNPYTIVLKIKQEMWG
jgi:hypothetical protein